MGKSTQLQGTALTVKGALADNLLFNKAISLAQPGDVIVVNDCGNLHHSVCGDLMYQYAITKEVAGVVVVRPQDAAQLIEEAKAVVARELAFDAAIAAGKWEESAGFQMINNLVGVEL